MSLWWLFLFCPIAYLIGNLNFSVVLSKYILKNDVRKLGSGNPGASNMLRNFGFKWALLTLILEMLKSILPTLIGMWSFGGFHYNFTMFGEVTNDSGQIAMYSCGIATIIGNCFPVIYGFKGGKGVATTVGFFFVINPVVTFIMILVGVLIAGTIGYAMISSFAFITVICLWEGFVKSPTGGVIVCLIGIYIFIMFMHRKNIYRLLTGKENRVSLRKKKPVIPPEESE